MRIDMSEIKDGGPAFPVNTADISEVLLMRDYFAAKAMQALVPELDSYKSYRYLASDAYKLADAMLAEREKK
jgi:hypothetical protein